MGLAPRPRHRLPRRAGRADLGAARVLPCRVHATTRCRRRRHRRRRRRRAGRHCSRALDGIARGAVARRRPRHSEPLRRCARARAARRRARVRALPLRRRPGRGGGPHGRRRVSTAAAAATRRRRGPAAGRAGAAGAAASALWHGCGVVPRAGPSLPAAAWRNTPPPLRRGAPRCGAAAAAAAARAAREYPAPLPRPRPLPRLQLVRALPANDGRRQAGPPAAARRRGRRRHRLGLSAALDCRGARRGGGGVQRQRCDLARGPVPLRTVPARARAAPHRAAPATARLADVARRALLLLYL